MDARQGCSPRARCITLAILVVLVPDSYADAHIAPGLERLASILVGVLLIGPVMLARQALAAASQRAKASQERAESE